MLLQTLCKPGYAVSIAPSTSCAAASPFVDAGNADASPSTPMSCTSPCRSPASSPIIASLPFSAATAEPTAAPDTPPCSPVKSFQRALKARPRDLPPYWYPWNLAAERFIGEERQESAADMMNSGMANVSLCKGTHQSRSRPPRSMQTAQLRCPSSARSPRELQHTRRCPSSGRVRPDPRLRSTRGAGSGYGSHITTMQDLTRVS